MRLILIGPPGCGKGTQAKLLGDRLGTAHFSTGDILRAAVAKDTADGRKAKAFMNQGQLVPDELVNDIVRARFQEADKPLKFVMDGYPRTHAQAIAFDKVLSDVTLPLDGVVFLNVADEEIVRRLSGRWSCPNPSCKAIYQLVSQAPKVVGVCDRCQSKLVQRDDDKPETIRKRLEVFHSLHDDIMRHYQNQGLLIEVPGAGDVEAIYASVIKGLGARKK
jgi:adenylate kinase